jgi:hypothetical protein
MKNSKQIARQIINTTLTKINEEFPEVKNCPKCKSKGLGGNVPVGHPNGMDTIWLPMACCSNPDCEFSKTNYQDYDKWQEMERENDR